MASPENKTTAEKMAGLIEKKYRVDSFDDVLVAIARIGAEPTIDVRSKHYYAHLKTDDTVKMVAEKDKVEIHRLTTEHGTHRLDEVIPLRDEAEGFAWFRAHGYNELDVLSMRNREFDYQEGGLALYEINDTILSVVLGYPKGKLAQMEQAFGLQNAEEIALPYNKYLQQIGQVTVKQLSVI